MTENRKRAARQYGIPRATLQRHIKKAIHGKGVEKIIGRPTVLTAEQENDIEKNNYRCAKKTVGLTIIDIRSLVFQYVHVNKIAHPFNMDDKLAGKDWMSGLMKRHPNLALRKLEPTSFARATGFNAAKVNLFFDNLEKSNVSRGWGCHTTRKHIQC